MASSFSFFDEVLGRESEEASPQTETRPREKTTASWPEAPAEESVRQREAEAPRPLSFHASQFSSSNWDRDVFREGIVEPHPASKPRRPQPRRMKPIREVPEAPQEAAAEEPAPVQEEKPKQVLLPAPAPEEIARSERESRAKRQHERRRSDKDRAWSKTVETVKSI